MCGTSGELCVCDCIRQTYEGGAVALEQLTNVLHLFKPLTVMHMSQVTPLTDLQLACHIDRIAVQIIYFNFY